MSPSSATAKACANVALVKYWGKRDEELNLPATGSISLTLEELTATARVFRARAGRPRFVQDGRVVEGLAGLLGGQLSFDLGDILAGGELGLGLSPELVSIEALDDNGLYGIYLDVFGEDL